MVAIAQSATTIGRQEAEALCSACRSPIGVAPVATAEFLAASSSDLDAIAPTLEREVSAMLGRGYAERADVLEELEARGRFIFAARVSEMGEREWREFLESLENLKVTGLGGVS